MQRLQFGRGLIERGAGRDDEVGAGFAADAAQDRETLRRDFGIGQDILHGREFRFRQKERLWQPVGE